MRGQFLQNISIYNGNINKEPRETTPPLFRFSSSHVVAPCLIVQVYTAHVVVVCLHDSVIPHGIGLRAQKKYIGFLSFYTVTTMFSLRRDNDSP